MLEGKTSYSGIARGTKKEAEGRETKERIKEGRKGKRGEEESERERERGRKSEREKEIEDERGREIRSRSGITARRDATRRVEGRKEAEAGGRRSESSEGKPQARQTRDGKISRSKYNPRNAPR